MASLLPAVLNLVQYDTRKKIETKLNKHFDTGAHNILKQNVRTKF